MVCYQVLRSGESTALWHEVKLANRPWSRLKGLLGRTSLGPEEGLWFTPCNSIHSIGMKFVFDAVFLDKTGKVVALKEHIPPGKLLPIVWGAAQVLELSAGAIAAKGLTVGDHLELASAVQTTKVAS